MLSFLKGLKIHIEKNPIYDIIVHQVFNQVWGNQPSYLRPGLVSQGDSWCYFPQLRAEQRLCPCLLLLSATCASLAAAGCASVSKAWRTLAAAWTPFVCRSGRNERQESHLLWCNDCAIWRQERFWCGSSWYLARWPFSIPPLTIWQMCQLDYFKRPRINKRLWAGATRYPVESTECRPSACARAHTLTYTHVQVKLDATNNTTDWKKKKKEKLLMFTGKTSAAAVSNLIQLPTK